MQVTIKYPNGCMQINLENFFPTSQKNVKGLLKVISMDWEHEGSIKQQIKVWLMQEITLCENQNRKKKLQKNLMILA